MGETDLGEQQGLVCCADMFSDAVRSMYGLQLLKLRLLQT